LPCFFDDCIVVRERLLARPLPPVRDGPGTVDYINGAPRHPRISGHVITADVVVGDHLALEIADEVERQTAKLFGEGLVREHRIDADAVDADAIGGRRLVP